MAIRPRRTKAPSYRPPVELLPELDIPGLYDSFRKPPQEPPATEARILEDIRQSAIAHDPIIERQCVDRAKALGVNRHQIEMARLAAVDDSTEGRSGPNPWIPKV